MQRFGFTQLCVSFDVLLGRPIFLLSLRFELQTESLLCPTSIWNKRLNKFPTMKGSKGTKTWLPRIVFWLPLRTQFIHSGSGCFCWAWPLFCCVWFVLLWFAFGETQIWLGDLWVVVCCFVGFLADSAFRGYLYVHGENVMNWIR